MQPEYSTGSARRTSDVTHSVWRYGRLLAPSVRWPVALIEGLVGTLAFASLCLWLKPDDPLLFGLAFPWIWLVPLLFSLRYGSLLGLFSALLLLLFWHLPWVGQTDVAFPAEQFVGGFLFTLLAGHFSDIWATRIRHLQGVNDYVGDRLSVLTNNHYLLRISHERLEKELLAQPATLRDAIAFLQKKTAVDSAESLPGMASVLQFVALNCQLESASVYRCNSQGLEQEPVASIGGGCPLNSHDPLLREALENKTLVHLQQLQNRESDYLACAPIKNARGELRAVLLIQRMPFLAVNHDNFQLLMTLLNYYVDGLENHQLIAAVQQHVPACPDNMALELARLSSLQANIGVRSSLLVMAFPLSGIGQSLCNEVRRQQRSLDLLWSFDAEHAHIAVLLMPLVNRSGVDGYLMRLESRLVSQYDTDLSQAGVAVHNGIIDSHQPGSVMAELLERCNVHPQ